jgi:hypothetical protein
MANHRANNPNKGVADAKQAAADLALAIDMLAFLKVDESEIRREYEAERDAEREAVNNQEPAAADIPRLIVPDISEWGKK